MPITFQNADVNFTLPERSAIQAFIQQQILNMPFRQSVKNSVHRSGRRQNLKLSFVFCSDKYLLELNQQFLGHNYFTDIITFPLDQNKKLLEAEIYISIERVKENSLKFKKTSMGRSDAFYQELIRVIFHGVLHLLGHKDKTANQKADMRRREDEWINSFEEARSKNKKPKSKSKTTHK